MLMRQAKRRMDDDSIGWIVVLLAKLLRTGASGGIRNQGGGHSVVPPRLDAIAQVVQHPSALSPTGVDHGEHSLHEPTPLRAVGASACLPPQHAVSLGLLCFIVGRFHTFLA